MPTAPVNDDGAFLYYEDTGPVEGQKSYVTLVMIHGLIFHRPIFNRLMAMAKNYGMRLITLNWRDYPNSSPYTASELEAFKSRASEDQVSAMEKEGRQIARFIEYVINNENIPPLERDGQKKRGGISVLAWSLGNVFLLPFLANAHLLEKRTQTLLEKYLRTAIVFDPPVILLGKPLPDLAYLPFRDPSIKPEALPEIFTVWVSTHYPAISDIESLTEQDIAAENRKGDTDRIPTILEMPPAERAEITDLGVLARSAGLYMTFNPDVSWQNFVGAMFDTKGALPDVNVVAFWCDKAICDCVWSAKAIADAVKEYSAKPVGQARKLQQHRISGANHFVHFHEPERMMQLLAEYA